MKRDDMDTTDEAFEALLRYLRDARGFDFTGYKRTSLMRRVRHRMDQAGYDTFDSSISMSCRPAPMSSPRCSTRSSSTSRPSSGTRRRGSSSAPT